ncbi:unnamed protein product [Heterobilharzia americana]|nr:unnamed protein product [Heterobilharzia americana]
MEEKSIKSTINLSVPVEKSTFSYIAQIDCHILLGWWTGSCGKQWAARRGGCAGWTAEKNLEDLDFAGDLCLMSHKLEDLQTKTNKLAGEAAKTGLQVNIEKTEVMKIPNQQLQQQQQTPTGET